MIADVIRSYVDNLENDIYTQDMANTVFIGCANRGEEIRAILASPLQVGTTAKYTEMMNFAFPELKQGIEAIDATFTLFAGMTVQQPWFGRKYWTSTDPLTFEAELVFIAQSDAKTEVFQPCIDLLGYLYPRDADPNTKPGEGGASDGLLKMYIPPGPNLFSGIGASSSTGSKLDQKQGVIKNAVTKIFAGANAQPGPDYVTFRLGKMVFLEYCYLDSVYISFSQALDSDGYPHFGKAKIKISTFDNSVWSGNHFSLSQQSNLALTIGNIYDSGAKALETSKSGIFGLFS